MTGRRSSKKTCLPPTVPGFRITSRWIGCLKERRASSDPKYMTFTGPHHPSLPRFYLTQGTHQGTPLDACTIDRAISSIGARFLSLSELMEGRDQHTSRSHLRSAVLITWWPRFFGYIDSNASHFSFLSGSLYTAERPCWFLQYLLLERLRINIPVDVAHHLPNEPITLPTITAASLSHPPVPFEPPGA